MIANYERMFGESPKQTAKSPIEKGDHPELDQSDLLPPSDVVKYQSLIGSLQWVVTIDGSCRLPTCEDLQGDDNDIAEVTGKAPGHVEPQDEPQDAEDIEEVNEQDQAHQVSDTETITSDNRRSTRQISQPERWTYTHLQVGDECQPHTINKNRL